VDLERNRLDPGGVSLSTARRLPLPLVILLALVVGLTSGGFAGAAVLIGPGGFRPATATKTVLPDAHPSASLTASPSSQPHILARSDAGMAFDQGAGEMLMFGGVTGDPCQAPATSTQPQTQTWVWNGQRWRLLEQSSRPSQGFSPSMAYDAVHRTVVMHLGWFFGFDETWTWNGSRWLLASPTTYPPRLQWAANEPLFWDSADQSVELFAYTRYRIISNNWPELNQLWSWDGSTWSPLRTAGSPPSGHGLQVADVAYESARQTLVFFGHVGATNTPTTWTFDSKQSKWTMAATSGPADLHFSLAADDARSNVVLFTETGTTWVWDGTRWTARNPLHAPSARIGQSMAYDSSRQVIVLFGGQGIGPDACTSYGDTWTWNGTDWTQVA
jgi:hypothetical protein